MPKPRQDPKSTALKNDAVLNPHPDAVTDALFQSNAFFDARDLVQVKYEMLRRARAEGMPKADAAQAFVLDYEFATHTFDLDPYLFTECARCFDQRIQLNRNIAWIQHAVELRAAGRHLPCHV
jgi:hypothetical protein